MALYQEIWSLDQKKPLDSAVLANELELEHFLCNHIQLLNRGWLVIGEQVRTSAGKLIDILCMDHSGNMIVVELKKDLTPRDVTAQVIDYAASVSKLSAEDIAQIYLNYSKGEQTLNAAYRNKYGTELDEATVNETVKMVIVAAKMDNGTERIIRFLRDTYQVDINILFFQVFRCGEQRLISRAWLAEDMEESTGAEVSRKDPWNGEYYVSFGEDARNWDDAKKYGFISAGGGSFYTKTLGLLSPGDRVWVNIPRTGYVGVGIVEEPVAQAKDVIFTIDGQNVQMQDLELRGDYFYAEDDPERAEYIVKVKWIKTLARSKAVKELGFFGNQNTVCRPTAEKWNFTVERLKKLWNID